MAPKASQIDDQNRQYIQNPGNGMVVDGIAASEAIDTSGEILSVKGCDISSLTVDGTINVEHRGDDALGYSFNDIIGRIVEAKKIFAGSDCDTDRQKHYWNSIQLPFIYFRARLFDGAGHPGAIAAAAMIRDMLHAGEPLLSRWSIEGTTLQRKGNILEKSVARRIALTVKPCNRSATSGVIADPNGPPLPVSPGHGDNQRKSEHEHPGYARLSSYESVALPPLEQELEKDMKSALAGVATGAAMVAGLAVIHPPAQPVPTHQAHAHQTTATVAPPPPPAHTEPAWHPHGLDRELYPIAHLESSFGQNTHHAANTQGELHTAVGALGLKPATALEEYKHNRALQKEFGADLVQDQHAFLNRMKEPAFYNRVATSLWQRMKRSLGGDPARTAFAWRWGKEASLEATPDEVEADPYVQKYMALASAAHPSGRSPEPLHRSLSKTTTAGGAGAAPSALTGGAALSREQISKVLEDWDGTLPLKEFLTSHLPDADPAALNRFADLAEDLRVKKLVQSPEHLVRKFERLSDDLRKAAGAATVRAGPQPSPRIKLDSRDLEPGEAVRNGAKFHVIHQDANNAFVVPQGKDQYKFAEVQKWPMQQHGMQFQITRPKTVNRPTLDGQKHVVSKLVVNDAQRALIHGMELKSDKSAEPSHYQNNKGINADRAYWTRGGKGQPVYVKRDDGQDGPLREVLYHNLAHTVFGLGQHVPTTTLIRHPSTNEPMVAVEGIPGAEHIDSSAVPVSWHPFDRWGSSPTIARHKQHLLEQGQNGTLDKLAVMNYVLGNGDRHAANWMYDPNGGDAKIKLIDHGHAFDRPNSGYPVADYHTAFHVLQDSKPKSGAAPAPNDRPLHPEAVKWLRGLDPEAIRQNSPLPSRFTDRAYHRLKAMQQAAQVGDLTARDLDLSRDKFGFGPQTFFA